MAQEGSDASITSTSANPNWWDNHANPVSSWNQSWQHQHLSKPISTACDGDISISGDSSFTNASTHSGPRVGYSSAATDLSSEPASVAENHLWRQVLLNSGSGGDLHKNRMEPSRDITFGTVCDYLKKLDESWEFTAPTPAFGGSCLEQRLGTKAVDQERRPSNPSDMASNWSIAPPRPQFDHHGGATALLEPYRCGPGYGASGCSGGIVVDGSLPGNYGHEVKDVINFKGSATCCIPKPPSIKSFESPDRCKKRGLHDVSSFGRGHVKVGMGNASEGKKKRSDQDTSKALSKKSKHEISSSPSSKFQAPKVKLGEKITALQQIVSPFGKTDTASVLLEAIKCIRFLHGKVQLLCNPVMKPAINKDLNSWGGLEKNDKQEKKQDLSSRGLCLVPISCTSQIYPESTGSDHWTPTYRGCLYR